MKKYGFVYVTISDMALAKKLAQVCLKKKLVACANIIPSMTSLYQWEDQLKEESECVIIMKTREDLFKTLSAVIKKHHPYECPCIVWIPISKIEPTFLKWIKSQLR